MKKRKHKNTSLPAMFIAAMSRTDVHRSDFQSQRRDDNHRVAATNSKQTKRLFTVKKLLLYNNVMFPSLRLY